MDNVGRYPVMFLKQETLVTAVIQEFVAAEKIFTICTRESLSADYSQKIIDIESSFLANGS